ncbi:TPA: hypothetical protein PL523_004353 [Cronobacter turicensis]|nr:hypothetical protein [Cronobacter turicensis]HDI3035709.1 hypothetical protein [Cronobacter turicensis]
MQVQQTTAHMNRGHGLYLGVEMPTLPENFTGRIALYIEDGRITSSQRIRNDEFIASIEGFIETALCAGFKLVNIGLPENNTADRK